MPTIKWSGKVTRSHSTATDTAAEVIDIIHGMPEVTKISLGHIKNIGGGTRKVKFKPSVGGFTADVRGSGAVQTLYVYTEEPPVVQKKVTEEFHQT